MSKLAIAAAGVVLFSGYIKGSHHADLAPTATTSDTSATFSWSGTVPGGRWLRIRDLAGDVEVTRASGPNVEIHAAKQPVDWDWPRSTPLPVKFSVQKSGEDVVVCATSEDSPRCDASDLESSQSSSRSIFNWNDDRRPEPMRVTIALPAGVSLQAVTMHGNVRVADATGQVSSFSGHGDITLRQISGEVTAKTGHGDINVADVSSRVTANTGHGNVEIRRAGSAVSAKTGHGDLNIELLASSALSTNDMRFETGHGNVRVTAPGSLRGDVDLETSHGRVSTSFPLTFDDEQRDRDRHAHGVLATGGRSVRLFSGHGDVTLSSTSLAASDR